MTCRWARDIVSKAESPQALNGGAGEVVVLAQSLQTVCWACFAGEVEKVAILVGMGLARNLGGVLVCVIPLQYKDNGGT